MDTKNNKMVSFLKSSAKEVKEARAIAVANETEKTYRRAIEDLCDGIESDNNTQEGKLLSLVPSNLLTNLAVAEGYDASRFMKEDIAFSLKRQKDIENLEIFLSRYNELFGPYENMAMVERVAPKVASKFNNLVTAVED